jgi:limonene-1,2-epoxide hydrolase
VVSRVRQWLGAGAQPDPPSGQADPVRQYVAALNEGDAHVLETAWPGEVVVYDPRYGEIRGHKRLRQFVRNSQSWLAERHARVETVASTAAGDRAVVELLAHLAYGGRELSWPVAVVAESQDDRSVAFRSYFSRCVTDDGVRCAVEYNCVRWGSRDLPPQAGIGVYERGPDGLLAAARTYDDVEPPDPGGLPDTPQR